MRKMAAGELKARCLAVMEQVRTTRESVLIKSAAVRSQSLFLLPNRLNSWGV
jgi:hypothetical protein